MTGRPEPLFPLFAELTGLNGIGPRTAEHLAGLGVETPRDLLFTLPHSGVDRARRPTIQGLEPPLTATVEVTVGRHMTAAGRGRPYRVEVTDNHTSFFLVFFHAREDWLKRQLPEGARRLVSGKLELFDGVAQMVHPDHILPPEEAADIPAFEPVYPLTAGVTQRAMFKASDAVLDRMPELAEWIDPGLKAREGWPDWAEAMRAAHRPASQAALDPDAPARQRLAYDELFAHQLTLSLARAAAQRQTGVASVATGALQRKVLAALPYRPTSAQTRAIAEIVGDLAQPLRMNRLLQGDVGAGKTLVAFMALLTVVEAGGQGVM
ncbi:MAG: ATP-dependent DNA helicase RecG, partial [Pseudomonadota bacterium]